MADAEVWFNDLDALKALRKSPEYLNGALKDEPNFIDPTRSDFLVAQEHVIIDARKPGLVKGVWRMRHKPGTSLAEFRRHWIEIHGVIASKIRGVRRYLQSHRHKCVDALKKSRRRACRTLTLKCARRDWKIYRAGDSGDQDISILVQRHCRCEVTFDARTPATNERRIDQ